MAAYVLHTFPRHCQLLFPVSSIFKHSIWESSVAGDSRAHALILYWHLLSWLRTLWFLLSCDSHACICGPRKCLLLLWNPPPLESLQALWQACGQLICSSMHLTGNNSTAFSMPERNLSTWLVWEKSKISDDERVEVIQSLFQPCHCLAAASMPKLYIPKCVQCHRIH